MLSSDSPQNRLRIAYGELIKRGLVETQKDMALKMGASPSNISSALAGQASALTSRFFKRFNKAFDNIFDEAWLLTGEGEMLADVVAEPVEVNGYAVPLIPLEAMAGRLPGDVDGVTLNDCQYITVPVPGMDCAIHVYGDSMSPDYPSGCIAVLQRIDHTAFIEWGRVYVLDTVNGPVIKQVCRSEKADTIQCRSLNPDPAYAPYDVPLTSVRQMFAVRLTVTPH